MWYFAYGSNLNSRAVAEWCRHYGFRAPAMKPGFPAVLDNFRLSFPIFSEYYGGGIGDIVYDPGKYVMGALFDLTDAELTVLDAKVNRKLDADYSDGIEVIRRIKTDPKLSQTPCMLVTNYPEHQQAAVAVGAEPGFGKLTYHEPATHEKLAKFLK